MWGMCNHRYILWFVRKIPELPKREQMVREFKPEFLFQWKNAQWLLGKENTVVGDIPSRIRTREQNQFTFDWYYCVNSTMSDLNSTLTRHFNLHRLLLLEETLSDWVTST